ncbi:CTP-dependent riboflavin kinase [Halorhodospira sp. 9621]|uniref:CTP-dependent riboflavin kinase n=1 Tax=Halorhodospira sp. 9621 TaxID=2899135 RepID=UPI001EE7E5AB|nr:CTP-dependent riboflavin kinase [Halorhodospira sp. 9621]MCG5533000.1 CTP-dependent riboflavin kinase [Halorhodospira sp. 9621]
MRLSGQVCAGRGLASQHLATAPQELEHWLGAPPVAGTLNLVTNRPYRLNTKTAKVFDEDHKMVWPARAGDSPVLVYRWPGCPLHVFELISPVRLRDALGLADGDRLQVHLPAGHLARVSASAWVVWALLWGLRTGRYYRSLGSYPALAEGLGLRLGASQ